jgi:hypothetical protein
MMSSTAASTTRRTAFIESHANRVHRRRQSCRVYHSKGPDWLRGVHGRRKDCRHVRDDAPRGYVFAGACSASAMTAARASLVRPCDGATIAPFRVVQPSPAVAVKNSCARMAAVAVIEKYCVAAPDSGTRQTTVGIVSPRLIAVPDRCKAAARRDVTACDVDLRGTASGVICLVGAIATGSPPARIGPGVALRSAVARAGKITVRATNVIHPIGTLRFRRCWHGNDQRNGCAQKCFADTHRDFLSPLRSPYPNFPSPSPSPPAEKKQS